MQAAQRALRDYNEQNSAQVDELESFTLPIFAKQVARNRPAVFRSWGSHLPCLAWTPETLKRKLGAQTELNVAVTPDGRADAVHGEHFVEPLTETMTLEDLLSRVQDDTSDPAYFQDQNGCFADPRFAVLRQDVGSVEVADEFFEAEPDAVNLWIGDERSVTCCHSDPYENLYLCVRGTKTFTLFPPVALVGMHYQPFKRAKWVREDGNWRIEPSAGGEIVPWIPVDPLKPDLAAFPRASPAEAMTVTLEAGDLLYLPALWLHRVAQQGSPAIAVNWWYDMDYSSPVWSLYQLVRSISLAADGHEEQTDPLNCLKPSSGPVFNFGAKPAPRL